MIAQYDKKIDKIRKESIELDNLKAKYNQLASGNKAPASLTAMESQLKRNEKEVENLETKLKEAEKSLTGTNLTISTTQMNTGNVPLDLIEQQNFQTIEVENLTSKLKSAREESQRLKLEVETLKLNPMASMEAQNLKAKIAEAEREISKTKNESSQLGQEIVKTNKFNFDNIKDSAENTWNGIAKYFNGKDGIKNGIESISNKITKLSKKITRLALTAMVFRLLRQSLTQLSNSFISLLKSNDDFSNSLNQIKANLMTAFTPIYNAVLPAINSLMDALSRVTGTIATFASSLFGQTASQAKKNAKELYNQANATKAVGEAQESLASFDKLEVNGDSSSKNGGGGSSNNPIDFSGNMEINQELLNFLNKIKSLIGDGKWFDVGATLANSLNNALGGLNIESFFNKGKEIAVNLINGFNGFINTFDWGLLAQKISKAILGLGDIILTGLVTIDWEGIGQAIGDFLLGIDWWGILVQLLSIVSGLFDAIVSLLIGFLGSCVEHIVEWIPKIWDFISQAPGWIWDNVLLPIWNTILEVLSSIGNGIGAFWDGVCQGAEGLWKAICDIWNGIWNWVNRTIVEPITKGISDMWNGLCNGAKNAWDGVKQTFNSVASFFGDIFGKAWEGVKKVFSTGGKVFDGIKDGIVNAFKAVVNALITGINKVVALPFNGLNGILNTIHNIDILGVKPFDWLTWRAPVPQLPYLATGAVIPPNAKFAAVLGDQKHGKNLEAPESLIRKIVREESSDKEVILNATFIMQCETEEIGRASLKGIRLLENLEGEPYFVR